MAEERYNVNQRKTVEWMLENYESWAVIDEKGTCKLVKNAACTCQTPEGRRRLKNKKDKTCRCKRQSTRCRNKVKGKQHSHLRVHQAQHILNEGKIPLWPKGKVPDHLRLHCSHICGRGNCRTKEHVTKDTQKDNDGRKKKCHALMIEDGKLTQNKYCTHSPKCIYNH